MAIALTGSQGFVGQGLLAIAAHEKISLQKIARKDYLNPESYRGVKVVIHLAGLAHRKSYSPQNFIEVNSELAVNCAKTAAYSGVKRFIYISSSKALGNFSVGIQSIEESHTGRPTCDYGRSKLLAENELLRLHHHGMIRMVVVRPALVIGTPAKANLKSLAILADWSATRHLYSAFSNWIFTAFNAPRSYTCLENLCFALLALAQSDKGDGEIFHVVDDIPISAREMFLKMQVYSRSGSHNFGELLELKASSRENSNPSQLLRLSLPVLGFSNSFNALARPFVLDGTKIQRELGWKPKPLLDVELQRIMASLPNSDDRPKG